MRKTVTIVLAFFAAVALVTAGFTYNQVNKERVQLVSNLQYRSSLLADGLREAIEPNFGNQSDAYLQDLVKRYSNFQRIAGLAVFDNDGNIVAMSSNLPKQDEEAQKLATNVMDADTSNGELTEVNGTQLYIYAAPLHQAQNKKSSVVGALMVVQNASYINDQLGNIWKDNLTRMFVQTFLFVMAAFLLLRWVIILPVQRFAASLHATAGGSSKAASGVARHPILSPIMSEVSRLQLSLAKAQKAAKEADRSALEKLDKPWTESRLREFTKDVLKDRTITVLSNLEPYIHTRHGNDIKWHVPASGLITAIEPVMQATGGVWVAEGSGDADRLVVDGKDTVAVPPDDPKYRLKRVWLTDKEKAGYNNFCDKALYPLCHMAHVRPSFRTDDWEQYVLVNQKFAKTILAEIKDLEKPVVFIQDFQFTLLPQLIKDARPDATVGLFWHIPWVNAEAFSICPWRKEMLDGMLGADLLGFHTQLHCNNFIDTVGHELEALIDYESFTVTRSQHVSLVRPFPISISFTGDDVVASKSEIADLKKSLLKAHGVKAKYVGFGVDRFDYIKGLTERFTAVDIFMEKNPSMRGKFTFIQISAPPETKSAQYAEFEKIVDDKVNAINAKYKTKDWRPIVFLKHHHSHDEVAQYYKIADLCLVSSLHDGMNLVAKEYIAARNDERGVLILSQFAGASKELGDALIVNPYDAVETAKAMRKAIAMPASEQTKRMKKMRAVVKNYNIYRWSAEFIKTIASLE